MTDYDDIPYHYAQFKASHNSYAKHELFIDQLSVESKKGEVGCRGLELDLHRNGQGDEWSVSHDGEYSGDQKKQLLTYLWALDKWADDDPDHDPVTLHLDIKTGGNVATGADALDDYLREYLGEERIFSPGDLMGGGTDLVAEAMKGWPTLGDLRGQFVICVTGNKAWKKAYSEMKLKSRLCFSDFDLQVTDKAPDTTTGTRVFANIGYSAAVDQAPRLMWLREQRGFVSRVYNTNQAESWTKVRKAGGNVIATDKIRGCSFASVGDEVFVSTLDTLAGM